MGIKRDRFFYEENPNKLTSMNDLAEHLLSLLNSGCYVTVLEAEEAERYLEHVDPNKYTRDTDGRLRTLILGKALFDTIKGLKIEVYSREHSPPHFHVKDDRVNAEFLLDDCSYMKGKISGKNIRLIEYWYLKAREKLIEFWNERRATDCVVGEFRHDD